MRPHKFTLIPVIGRKKQMIKFKGTTLYPPALFDLLNEMEEVLDFVVDVYSNEIGMDEVLLHLLPADDSKACDNRIRAYLQARLRVSPHVTYITAEEIQKCSSRKPAGKWLNLSTEGFDHLNQFNIFNYSPNQPNQLKTYICAL